jgi:DHA1 family multidrug resistance protein-like MFS transporter
MCVTQFGATFSYNFVQIFFPFFIMKISPYPVQYTLLWSGVILGSSNLCAAITSPFWGSLTHRFSPKMLYLRAVLSNLVTFLVMAFTTDLYVILFVNILQGLTGGISTIGLIIVSSSSRQEDIPSHISLYQSVMTLGQLTGPPIGSLAAVALGYRGAFLACSAILLGSMLYCYLYVKEVPCLPGREPGSRRTGLDKPIVMGWVLCFMAMIHLSFLPSILPQVFHHLNVDRAVALKLAGTVVMCYTAAAMVGTYLFGGLSKRTGLRKLITTLLVVGVLSQGALVLSRGVLDFTLIRMIQTGAMAALVPLVVSIFARESRGGVIGFLNSARFTGNAIGPMFATSVLAVSSIPVLYLSISLLTLLALLGVKFVFKTAPSG